MGLPAPDQLQEGDPLDEGHGQVGEAVDLARLDDLKQRRAGQPGSALGLAAELGKPAGVPGQDGIQDLQGHEFAGRLHPPGLPDSPLRTLPQAANQQERAKPHSGTDRRQQIGGDCLVGAWLRLRPGRG